MTVSAEYLLRCSDDTGFTAATLERVIRLGELAGDIATHPLLGGALALKGGTALNLGFGSPRRLSVDLDYDYVAHAAREEMLVDRPRIEDAVLRLAARHGYEVRQSANAFAGRKLHLRFPSALGGSGLAQVDINYLFRLPLEPLTTMTLWQPGGLDMPTVPSVCHSETLVGKLLALLERGAPRDAWDVSNLPPPLSRLLGQTRFRQLFLTMAATLDHPLPTYRHERLTAALHDQAVGEQLSPVLATAERFRAVELATAAWSVVEPFLMLSDEEVAYFAALAAGDLRLDFLFPDEPSEVSRLSAHPALRWKVMNTRRRLRRM